LLSVCGGAWISAGLMLLVLPPVLLLRMALNALDGMLARRTGSESLLGKWLNELGDVISDAALYLPHAARRFPRCMRCWPGSC